MKAASSATSPSRLPGLDRALNPYKGCSHSCAYCYAQDVTRFEMTRPWGSVIEVKSNIVQLLKKELARGPRGVYGMGTVTDPYQPIERRFELTRGCLLLLKAAGARVSVLTKSDLVLRDIDILRSWPEAEVGMSVSCMDDTLAAAIESGAPPPRRRLEALRTMSLAGISVYMMVAPVINGLTDDDESLRALVRGASACGVQRVMWDGYNPKPIASKRLINALEGRGIKTLRHRTNSEDRRIGATLSEECSASGIELLDAF